MNSYFFNEENKKKKKLSIVSLIVILLVICFGGSYFITDRLTNPKYYDNNLEEEKMVYNSNSILDDAMNIVLMKDGTIVKEQTVKEFKKENDISIAINEYFVVNYFSTDGYELTDFNSDKIVFAKDTEKITLEPNKYYLGEKDGYFAIFKTDSLGKAFIEDEKDVYRNNKLVNSIPTADQEEIKSFKHSYETKDEAKESLSGYIT